MTDTAPAPPARFADEIAATLDWWRGAGVDCDFSDNATAWLSGAVAVDPAERAAAAGPAVQGQRARTGEIPASPQAAQVPPPPANPLGESPPTTLAEFREFWLTAPGLDPIGPRGRVPPRGVAEPELMILVIDPEQEDADRLLSGPQGRLLTNILAAIGLAEDQVYLASALPRHTPMADAETAVQAGLAKVLAHHIDLVAPKRILALGGNILPLLQHGITMDETSLREINQKGSSRFVLISEGLGSLMASPAIKAKFWRRWNEWSVQF
jgi:DNA polymerase